MKRARPARLLRRPPGRAHGHRAARGACVAAPFRVEDFADRRAEELSKGNQQKIQFIAAVLHDPQVLLMDEPFTGLDPVNVMLLREAFLELRDRGPDGRVLDPPDGGRGGPVRVGRDRRPRPDGGRRADPRRHAVDRAADGPRLGRRRPPARVARGGAGRADPRPASSARASSSTGRRARRGARRRDGGRGAGHATSSSPTRRSSRCSSTVGPARGRGRASRPAGARGRRRRRRRPGRPLRRRARPAERIRREPRRSPTARNAAGRAPRVRRARRVAGVPDLYSPADGPGRRHRADPARPCAPRTGRASRPSRRRRPTRISATGRDQPEGVRQQHRAGRADGRRRSCCARWTTPEAAVEAVRDGPWRAR